MSNPFANVPLAPPPARVRFWAFINGSPVRLTLRDGQRIRWATGRMPTDEGWSQYGATYSYSDGVVRRHAWSDGVDCDGRLASDEFAACPAHRLRSVPPDGDVRTVESPEWTCVRSSQRDYQRPQGDAST